MANKMLLECVDRSIREVMENDQPFGGITVVFSGDWRQCLPIVPRGGKAEIMAATMKSSNLWRAAIVHKVPKILMGRVVLIELFATNTSFGHVFEKCCYSCKTPFERLD